METATLEGIDWLTSWYAANCDGEWEHHYGFKIDTLDNPGWWLRADLVDTPDEGRKANSKVFNNTADWYVVECNGDVFEASGDPGKLMLLIDLFRKFIEEEAED